MGSPAVESNGGSQGTEALYLEHGAAVARLCHSLLRDRAEAEDATQQVFLSAHRALLNGSAPREPLAWLLAVARNECYARSRRSPASLLPAGDVPDSTAPDASVHVLRAGELATVWEEVSRMPSTQREAFLLREIRGLSYTQLADELSLSKPSIRSLLGRARARLRHRLGESAAGLGAAPWIQAVVRLVGGGDGPSPVPAATKAAAVGIGALALAGGGDRARVPPHHASRTAGDPVRHHHAPARARHAATPAAVATAPVSHSELEHSRRRRDDSRDSGPDRTGSREDHAALGTSSGDSSSDGGHHGSEETTAVAPPTTDGSSGDGGSSTSSTSGRDASPDGSSPDPGSDGGSGGLDGGGSDGNDGG